MSIYQKAQEDIIRPMPIELTEPPFVFDQNADVDKAIKIIRSGKKVWVSGRYADGLFLLKRLRKVLGKPGDSFKEQRRFRKAWQKKSNRIIAAVRDGKPVLKKSPEIGWLRILYPGETEFYLSFPAIQGLNSSWQWFTKGIHLPVLRNKIHPYYGTYFPTRFDHLILFDNWLKQYKGSKKWAIDVGFGSGMLSLMLLKHKFQKVYATEINPNAVVGLIEYMGDTKLSRKIDVDYGHLFVNRKNPADLIVFNPPWLPREAESGLLDDAIYYDEKLFPEFFMEVTTRLLPGGLLIILFSNLAEVTELTNIDEHPVKKELQHGGRYELVQKLTRKVKPGSAKSKRQMDWRDREEVELWVLRLKNDNTPQGDKIKSAGKPTDFFHPSLTT